MWLQTGDTPVAWHRCLPTSAKGTCVSDQHQSATTSSTANDSAGFTWHPTYAGQSFDQVHAELLDEISRDQRSYKLAMDGAEGAEHDSLTTIVELERRWSTYDFDWAESDPKVLADRILTFEKDRERRKETLSFAEYRASGALVESNAPTPEAPARSLPVMQIGIVILVILLIVLAWIIFT
jgi:hypothetical protein